MIGVRCVDGGFLADPGLTEALRELAWAYDQLGRGPTIEEERRAVAAVLSAAGDVVQLLSGALEDGAPLLDELHAQSRAGVRVLELLQAEEDRGA